MSGRRSEPIRLERHTGGVALVTIDRAPFHNTLSVETLEALWGTMRRLDQEDLVAVVLTGAGGESFAAGANIREFASLSPREALSFAARGQRVFDTIERSPMVVIAAVDGYCMGGGLDLALACDIRYASPASILAHPGARLGIMTGFGGTARLSRLIGRARAIELFATGRRVQATEALDIGLVDRVVEDPVAAALETASLIAERWPVATASLKGSALRWWRRGVSGR